MPNPADLSKPTPPLQRLEWFGVFLVLVGSFFLVSAGQIQRLRFSDENDPGPRALPVFLSLVLIGGGAIELLSAWRRPRRPLSDAASGKQDGGRAESGGAAAGETAPATAEQDSGPGKSPPPVSLPSAQSGSAVGGGSALSVVILLCLLIAYLVAVPWCGFYASTVVFVAVVPWWLGAGKWRSIGFAVVLLVVIRLLFVELFEVQLPAGEFPRRLEAWLSVWTGA